MSTTPHTIIEVTPDTGRGGPFACSFASIAETRKAVADALRILGFHGRTVGLPGRTWYAGGQTMTVVAETILPYNRRYHDGKSA